MSSPTIPALLLMTAVLAGCATRTSYADLYGQPSPVESADRTIVIAPGTRYVNVEGGETVAFAAGNKQFGWNFSVAKDISSFNLNDVAPPGMLDHAVQAYITPDPHYSGGESR